MTTKTGDRRLGWLQDGLCGLAVAAAVLAGVSGGAAMAEPIPLPPIGEEPCGDQPRCRRIDGVCTTASGDPTENCDKRRAECICQLSGSECVCQP